jgi:LuxR family transcriptional regulator, maltose regulon positive regulatory protein
VLFAHADELEARLRLALGDRHGARNATERLPDDRRPVVSAIIALADNDWTHASDLLSGIPDQGTTIRTNLELRLLRAAIATSQGSPRAPRLVRTAVDVIIRHGFVQTVLETTPRLVDHLLAESARFPDNQNFRALLAAALEIRQENGLGSNRGRLPDPLTDAEIRVLHSLAQRLTYADIAAELNLSLNTVKTHLRHSYMKLAVSSRTTAIKRATSLGLI